MEVQWSEVMLGWRWWNGIKSRLIYLIPVFGCIKGMKWQVKWFYSISLTCWSSRPIEHIWLFLLALNVSTVQSNPLGLFGVHNMSNCWAHPICLAHSTHLTYMILMACPIYMIHLLCHIHLIHSWSMWHRVRLAFGRMTCLAHLVCSGCPIYPTCLTLYFGLFGLSNFLNCVQSYWAWCSCGPPNLSDLFSPPYWSSLLPKWLEVLNLFGMLGSLILPSLSNLFFHST